VSKRSFVFPEGRPTRRDVAALAEVSGTTVSRVLSGRTDQSVSASARARVMKAARELGYAPNSAAQALRSGHSGLIGFWMCLSYSRYRAEVLDRMRHILGATDYVLAVTDVDEDYVWRHSFDRALRVPVEGIIAFDASTSIEVFGKEGDRIAPNIPYVSMGAYWSESTSYVGVDLRAGAEMAVDHLIQTGRRRIAHVTSEDSDPRVEAGREAGYVDRMCSEGLRPMTLRVSPDPVRRVASLTEALAERRREGALPDALVCMFDDLAVDALPALQRLGLRPGVDVAIVGINGSEGTDRGACPLTVVRQPVERMCATAFDYLRSQIEDPTAPIRQTILRPELIVRQSTGPPGKT
jgi:LacI family transcriptional regulator